MNESINSLKTSPLEWEATDRVYKQKTNDWYWTVGVVGLALIIVAILMNNFLFGVIIFLGTFSVMMYGSKRPELVHFKINDKGVYVGNRMYPYDKLTSFGLDEELPLKQIILKAKSGFMYLFAIPLPDDADMEEIREALSNFLPEEKLEEPASSTLSRLIGL